jgi:hypothetical protein
MSDNTDNPAYPIIEFLNNKIEENEKLKDFFLDKNMPDSFKMSQQYIQAFNQVLRFINENFNEND